MVKLLLCGVMVVIGYWWWNGPSRGVTKRGEVVQKEIVGSRQVEYLSDQIRFKYPDKYRLENIESTDSKILENIRLVGREGVMETVVVSLREGNVGPIDELSAVKMRRTRPEAYRESTVNWQGLGGVRFVADGEVVSLFLMPGKLLTIAMTTNSTRTDLVKESDKLIESIDVF